MARISLGLGTSHSPQLSTGPEIWPQHAARDSRNQALYDAKGTIRPFEELVELAPPDMAKEITPEKWQSRYDACQTSIARVGQSLSKGNVDVLIMIGDDQHEMFNDDNMPAMTVYWGNTFLNTPAHPSPNMPESIRASSWANCEPEVDREYPVASELGLHLIQHLMERDFDIAHSKMMPERRAQMGHAFGFVYRRVMEKVVPTVPVMLNTYYPPNQPSPARCFAFGRALREAVESWPEDIKVGVIASGGLSHFVIDEDMDGTVLKALREHDADTLQTLPKERLNSGTSEIRNWIAMAGATEHLETQWTDYVPCYRSPAGTGCAMGFGAWGD